MKDRPAGDEGREVGAGGSEVVQLASPEHRGHWARVTALVPKGCGGQMSSSIKTLTDFRGKFTEA